MDFDTRVVDDVAHRPWPLPAEPWVMTQSWLDLLFAHWPVPAEVLRPHVPDALALDRFEGSGWIGIVPFQMANVSIRGVPPLPGVSAFPELNVRTYVTAGGRPGVYFFSLDAASWLAVRAARLLLNLPYFKAQMTASPLNGGVVYESRREHGSRPALFSARYRATGPPFLPAPGTLEYFLTERYCLYHVDRRGRPYRLEIHHRPWTLEVAEATFAVNTMAEAGGVTLPDVAPLLHVSRRQDTVAWRPVQI